MLNNLPCEALLDALQQQRGRGRNDFPVQAMWRATIAGIVFQPDSVEHLVRELHRNFGILQISAPTLDMMAYVALRTM